MKIEDILNQAGEGVLKEESVKLLTDAFNDAVTTQLQERVDIEVKSALEKLDEEHSTSLENLLEAIDIDHSNKLTSVLQKIDEDHTKKLQAIIEHYEKVISEDAKSFKEELVEMVSGYLDTYLNKAIPREELTEAVSNKRAQKILEQIKQLVAIDENFVNDTIREAVEDGNKTIDTLKKELNEAVKANIQLNQTLKGVKSELVLEKNTANFSKDKRNYILRTLAGKDPDFITENFDYVANMFDREEEKNTEILREQATPAAKSIDLKQPVAQKTTVTESVDEVDAYVSELKKQERK